jgi:hypothetical protein
VARFALAYAGLVEAGRSKPFNKERVARMLGMRPETFSRNLRTLSDRKLIESNVGLRVLDAPALERLAQS